MKRDLFLTREKETEMDQRDVRPDVSQTPLKGVRSNIVQSIRAYRVQDLQDTATQLGHHFLYANLATAQSKQDVLDMIAQQFTFPAHFGKNFDALYDCMTDPLHKSGPQPGFIVVLEHIPANGKFDKEAREQLLDIFRDTADYWADRKVPFRCFYSFAVARSAQAGADKAEGQAAPVQQPVANDGEKMPTDKILDVSPLALRMSSPFNAGYWLAAA
ncbi:barstar family protein [Ramlibacter sp. USB13]|uniref:Barstar family protein n=1 Tax=Ramlibacter cellulosilyticus TaxID=2764187 RepID=A0A923SAX1_9BURK|nr:barstar family protein [Ramlibacter cellulosilyticus]